jgi:esterase/lipase superfamily enzyme
MFSVFNMLLVSLLMVSDRDHFWDAEKISKETEFSWDSLQDEEPIDVAGLKDKKVLLVVHGFNNAGDKVMRNYRVVADHVSALKDTDGQALYDLVIGYCWPGYDDPWEYFAAKEHAHALKKRMKGHLLFLSSMAARVDVMAHSMGNRLMFEALNFSPAESVKKVVQNFYSLAAAVDNESIEKKQKYFRVSQNCEEIFVLHSREDDVLKFLYSGSEWDKALGFDGVENFKHLPENVQVVDCTPFITKHGQYFHDSNVYGFIRNGLLNLLPSPKAEKKLKMLANGAIEVIPISKK